MKLSQQLSRRSIGRLLYTLGGRNTALHSEIFHKLLEVSQQLIDWSDTIAIIEHHLELIEGTDNIIEFGPKGDGRVAARALPEEVAGISAGYTERFLRVMLARAITE